MYSFMRIDDVHDNRTLMEFTRQKFGCPCFKKDEMAFLAQAKRFFERNPHYTPHDLARVVAWAKDQRKRPSRLETIFHYAKDAYAAGILQSRQQSESTEVALDLYAALQVEKDPEWRDALLGASTIPARAQVLTAWRNARSVTPVPATIGEASQEQLFAV